MEFSELEEFMAKLAQTRFTHGTADLQIGDTVYRDVWVDSVKWVGEGKVLEIKVEEPEDVN